MTCGCRSGFRASSITSLATPSPIHRKDRETDAIDKLFASFVRRADKGTLSRLLVESTVLLAAARTNPVVVLRDAAAIYRVDTNAVALKVKQEFAAKEKAKRVGKSSPLLL